MRTMTRHLQYPPSKALARHGLGSCSRDQLTLCLLNCSTTITEVEAKLLYRETRFSRLLRSRARERSQAAGTSSARIITDIAGSNGRRWWTILELFCSLQEHLGC